MSETMTEPTPRSAWLGYWVLAAGLTVGCAVKPEVLLPAVTSTIAPVLVGEFGAADGVTDTRFLLQRSGVLYVAAASGLHIYDISDPAAPTQLSHLSGFPVDRVAVVGQTAYTIDIGGPTADGGDLLRVIDLTELSAPRIVKEIPSRTSRFGGLDAVPGLVWHAVGQIPPSLLYFGDQADPARVCGAPDRERGTMDVWLGGNRAVVSLHFDDFAGDGLDGNGAFAFVLFDMSPLSSTCPRVALTDIIFVEEHDKNRSKYERPSNSDLQAAYDPTSELLYLTGEQRLRVLQIDLDGKATEMGTIDLPEVLDVEVDSSAAPRRVAGLANGDFLLVDVTDAASPRFGGSVVTQGVARAVAAAGDGAHFYVADSEQNVVIVSYGETQ